MSWGRASNLGQDHVGLTESARHGWGERERLRSKPRKVIHQNVPVPSHLLHSPLSHTTQSGSHGFHVNYGGSCPRLSSFLSTSSNLRCRHQPLTVPRGLSPGTASGVSVTRISPNHGESKLYHTVSNHAQHSPSRWFPLNSLNQL